jgi:2-methylisocitrate lyase-like PEP mutase family enzyme
MRQTILIVTIAMLACARAPSAPRQSEAMERSARILRALDRLEADLHTGQSEAFAYSELVRRHSAAEQIACKVTDEHVAEIHRLAAIQEERMARKRLGSKKRKAVAMARPRPSRHAMASN